MTTAATAYRYASRLLRHKPRDRALRRLRWLATAGGGGPEVRAVFALLADLEAAEG